jgi:glycosyltransferase involved in cell wall biosynthesis
MKTPEVPVTVLMPVYNCANYVGEAVESILAQTYRDFEFLIVNDGSTDASEHVIRAFGDPRVRIISQRNAGVSQALNTGIAHARGKFIARFDADDICMPTRLEEQMNFMLGHKDHVMVGSDAEYVSDAGEHIFSYTSPAHADAEIRERIYQRNPFIHSAVLLPKQLLVECGGYDPRAHTFEDHLLWVKVIARGKVHNIPRPLVKVRLNPQSVTTDERLRGRRFLALRRKILLRGTTVTPEEEAILLEIIRRQNTPPLKQLGYHLFVMKKYLWNNHQPLLARKHIRAALRLKPLDPRLYMMLAVSVLPGRLLGAIYNLLKG